MRRRALSLLGTVLVACSLHSAPARAIPWTFSDLPSPVLITCPAVGLQLQVAATGKGEFAPAREVDGTRVFIPVHFGPAVTLYIGPDGEMFHGDNFLVATKGKAPEQQAGVLECRYTASTVGDGSNRLGIPAGWAFTIWGSVTGKVEAAS